MNKIFDIKRLGIVAICITYIFVMLNAPVQAQLSTLDAVIHNRAQYDPCAAGSGGDLSGNSAAGAADGFPLRLPLIKDANRVAEVIDKFISETPNSPYIGMGKYFVQGGMRAGVNPLLAVAQAKHESNLGTTGISQRGNNNGFGRTASPSQPRSGKWYVWESWQKSLYSDNSEASGDIGDPDDWFIYVDRKMGDKLDANDIPAYIEIYAPAFENDTAAYLDSVLSTGVKLAEEAGADAIDLTQYGTASSSDVSAPDSTGGSDSSTGSTDSEGGGKTVVALDPGHGGLVDEYTDEVTKLGDRETDNSPEREDVLDVAKQVKEMVEKEEGYEAVLLRTSPDQKINKRERVKAAQDAGAKMGVSIHTDTTPIEEVWPQFIGGYRSAADDSIKVEFKNEEVANQSKTYSDNMAKTRSEAQGFDVKVVQGQPVSFGKARGLPSYGDLSLIQLFADNIPWVYNESTAPAGGMNEEQKLSYAKGIADGILQSVKPGEGSSDGLDCGGGGSFSGGDLSATTLAYAWPDYRAPPYTEKKPEYQTAIEKAQGENKYVGGGSYPGVDCGGFVTRLLQDSGFEPEYNSNNANVSEGQYPWIRENWQEISVSSTADLQPGDVAINHGLSHTFVYVGEIPGFDSVIASASYSTTGQSWRAPMAGQEEIISSSLYWFRKKGA